MPDANLLQAQTTIPNGFSLSYPGLSGGRIPMNPIPEVMNELLEIEAEKFAPNSDMDILDDVEKLLSIDDPF